MDNVSNNLMNGISTNISDALTSGLPGTVEILVDDDIKQIGNYHKIVRKPFGTLGIDTEGKPVNTEALIISENTLTSDWLEAKFDNGLVLKCLPSVEVLTKKGYIKIEELKSDDELVNMIYPIESGEIKYDITKLESIKKINNLIPELVYFICSKTCNIMIPTFNNSGKYLSFITIKQ